MLPVRFNQRTKHKILSFRKKQDRFENFFKDLAMTGIEKVVLVKHLWSSLNLITVEKIEEERN